MSALAPTLEAFFTDRLQQQRQASPHTIDAYATTFRLLLRFVHERTRKAPSDLDIADLDSTVIGAFLDHLEHDRHNKPQTRNSRLAAIHSLFRFAALHHPEHAEVIQRVLAIPTKTYDKTDIDYLRPEERDALLAAPDRNTWIGRRDHALLVVGVQTGLRVSELTGLCCGDLDLGKGPHVRCLGKGRKQRCTPLTQHTVAVITTWLHERQGESPLDPVFPTSRGGRLSSDAVALRVAKHAENAQKQCPTMKNKKVTPHVLRHTAAMTLLHAGVDPAVIALWLGHENLETTQMYVRQRTLGNCIRRGQRCRSPVERMLGVGVWSALFMGSDLGSTSTDPVCCMILPSTGSPWRCRRVCWEG